MKGFNVGDTAPSINYKLMLIMGKMITFIMNLLLAWQLSL